MPFNWGGYFGKKQRKQVSPPFTPTGLAPAYDGPGAPNYGQLPPPNSLEAPFTDRSDIMRQIMPRLTMSAVTACCLFVTVIFLIMVEIGNTHNKSVLKDIWFMKFWFVDVSPDWDNAPGLGYGVAESLGLYDFYQIGLWNYCEGWNSTGLASCSQPSTTYWFNPVQIFNEQLGTSVSLPPDMMSSLDEIKTCSNWMFGLFMTGACLSFVLIPTVLVGVKSRWFSLGLSIITFLNALCVLAATIIATVMFVIMRDLFRDYVEIVNIEASIGSVMFAMMWIATAFAIFAFLIQAFLSCFLPSERDVRLGKKQGTMKSFF